jgi:hypothetical protein
MADDVRTIRNIVSASRHEDEIFMVMVEYDESDAINAGGMVLRCGVDREADVESLLSANDAIGYLWTSPAGSIWVSSGRGNVWTTAPVDWPMPELDWLDYEVDDDDYAWKLAQLPPLASGRGRPVLQLIWGTSDADVHVPCFQGSIYHWDGERWTEHPSGVGGGFNAIHGSGPNNVYAVGDNASITHWDGARWTRVPAPDEVPDTEAFTGVRVLKKGGDVLVCGRGGSILRGNAGGFEIVTQADVKFYGVTVLKNKTLLATREGVYELARNRAKLFFECEAVAGALEAGDDMALFLLSEQDPDPSIIDYMPDDEEDWWVREFPME